MKVEGKTRKTRWTINKCHTPGWQGCMDDAERHRLPPKKINGLEPQDVAPLDKEPKHPQFLGFQVIIASVIFRRCLGPQKDDAIYDGHFPCILGIYGCVVWHLEVIKYTRRRLTARTWSHDGLEDEFPLPGGPYSQVPAVHLPGCKGTFPNLQRNLQEIPLFYCSASDSWSLCDTPAIN